MRASVGGYCCSEKASDIVAGATPMTRAAFGTTFAQERARLELARFECTPA